MDMVFITLFIGVSNSKYIEVSPAVNLVELNKRWWR